MGELAKALARLRELQGESPMVPLQVDGHVVAEIIAAWTGIPLGKMVKDEINTVLNLKPLLQERVIGQDHALEAMHGFGFEQAIVTLGGDGSVVLDGTADDPEHRIQRIAPVRVKAVDTTGCGDSFMGTVLAGLASGMTLSQSAELASYVSAYAATGYGAQASYGTAAQIREAFADAE